MMDKENSVEKSFNGSNIFITGISGFLGKVLVEKLLYECDGIEGIYCLIRVKRGQKPSERLEELINGTLFTRIKAKNPSILNKIHVIEGDLLQPNLGMSNESIQLLQEKISIVFHCAATVKFDDILRVSLTMNLIGTHKLVEICRNMKNLKSLVHVSTAYANCHLNETTEEVYPSPVDPQQLINALSWMDDDMLEMVTPKLLNQRPNTYTFTKALAETQFIRDAKNLPAIIVRPSIIGACWKEPHPGWTDNYNGATGIIFAVGKGAIRVMPGDVNCKADIIPVDIVSNMLIVSAHYRMNMTSNEIPVFHCTSGELNPLKWKFINEYCNQCLTTYPMKDPIRIPYCIMTTNHLMFLFDFYLRCYTPAKIHDFIGGFIGKKQNNVNNYNRVYKMIKTLEFFTTNDWNFKSEGLVNLWNTLSKNDQEKFNFDIRQVNWGNYLFDYIIGIRLYLLKETISDLNQSKFRVNSLWKRNLFYSFIFWGFIVRLTASKTTPKIKMFLWLFGIIAHVIGRKYFITTKHRISTIDQYMKRASKT
ncbi:Male sterility, NAD-binding domain and NAD(P)-binding domain and Fatty acyl-CoA reductase family-containing protein [Strongyloides ratti]|uniref:Fatty acyl-CoA reductase n=1 Tax=Strongyloides ratti TaxID=34506 RepID=A0A090KW62_STRRB|nr:Male sterility, NAD-binding domain and NAD(P)-binding domain and Fatty acyl-CoA reductase family-containing protein [Strongyloides ratti]CEF59512.1 Male sterility, NAD-binding domain and NAD(P)-binding domain and Fatty acyl-CoA reductase family-containing protein [Strongyloides ratti]